MQTAIKQTKKNFIKIGILIVSKWLSSFYCVGQVHTAKKGTWGFISESLACCKRGSPRCRATRCCRGRGSSSTTAGTAAACVGNIQTATGRCPTPGWQTEGKGRVWAGGWILSPRRAVTVRTRFWTAGTYWSRRARTQCDLACKTCKCGRAKTNY